MTIKEDTPRKKSHSVYTLDEIRKNLLSSGESEQNFEFYHRYYLQGDFYDNPESDLKLEDVEGLEFDQLSQKAQIVVCKCIQKELRR